MQNTAKRKRSDRLGEGLVLAKMIGYYGLVGAAGVSAIFLH